MKVTMMIYTRVRPFGDKIGDEHSLISYLKPGKTAADVIARWNDLGRAQGRIHHLVTTAEIDGELDEAGMLKLPQGGTAPLLE